MDRTTIMLPPDLKYKASLQAKKKKISLGQYIREALRNSLETEDSPETEMDTLFQDDAIFEGETPDNLAHVHDAYLYEENK